MTASPSRTPARAPALLAALGSALMVAGAFGFQAAGYPPCHLCWLQRYPHFVAAALGLVLLVVPSRWIMALGGLAALTTAGLGLYHTGVEQGWWQGPTSCTSTGIGGLSVDDLMAQINAAPLVQCDVVQWQLLGLSMASWNALLSLGLAALWLVAFRRS
ncbi:disulfide bond formation protein B [Frigidibacter sp. MR17.24]|uniref:disulfide bond formation protein B n=1 Tax=Frigidibacter sp. MR17.24 TaxID=3127345 RepID=UPI003012F3CF